MGIAMIDTLCATVDIQNYENSMSDVLNLLKEKKQEAKQLSAKIMNEKTMLELYSMNFEIMSNGSKGYAYILHNSDYEIKFAEYRSKTENFFPIAIKIKSECLWCKSPDIAWLTVISWLNNFGYIISNKISRIDLCYHTDKFNVALTDLEIFKGTFHNDNIRRSRRTVNAIEFGSRTSQMIFCRIYNKTLELTKSKKLWFNEIWARNNLDINTIWNIEFQIDRNFLKTRNIETVEECFDRLQTIWNYCTTEWLVKLKPDNVRIERCSVADDWVNIQTVFKDYKNNSFISREKQLESDSEALVPAIAGLITSFGARKGKLNDEMLINEINKNSKKHLAKKNRNYQTGMVKKRLIL